MATLSVSALSRFSAISNDVRVRVLGSKNRLTTVLPRSAGTFLIGREPTSFIASAVDERNGWILESSLSATGLLKSMAKSWLRL